MRTFLIAATISAMVFGTTAPPAGAQYAGTQAAGLTFDQVQRKYRRMSPVFITKCDRNGDGIYTNAEMQCVAGIYQAMYLED